MEGKHIAVYWDNFSPFKSNWNTFRHVPLKRRNGSKKVKLAWGADMFLKEDDFKAYS